MTKARTVGQRRVKFTASQLLALYDKHGTYTKAAEAAGMHRTSVRDILIDAGLAPKKGGYRGPEKNHFHEVAVFADGGQISVSHGTGPEHAREFIAAMIGDRPVMDGYPRTERIGS